MADDAHDAGWLSPKADAHDADAENACLDCACTHDAHDDDDDDDACLDSFTYNLQIKSHILLVMLTLAGRGRS